MQNIYRCSDDLERKIVGTEKLIVAVGFFRLRDRVFGGEH